MPAVCVNCDDGDPCTTDSCDPVTQECVTACTPGAVASAQACPFSVVIKEITFTTDHQMYEEATTPQTTQKWNAGAAMTGVDWKDANNPDHPVCYTRGTTMTLIVKVEVTGSSCNPGTATVRVNGPDGISGEGTFSVPTGTEDRFMTIVTSALPGVVKAYSANLSWSAKAPGASSFTDFRTTNHQIYVTLGTPSGGLPTDKRLSFVCLAAAQAATVLEAVEGIPAFGGDGIHKKLDAEPPCDSQELSGFAPCGFTTGGGKVGTIANDWILMAGSPYVGECHHQAHLMNLAIGMIGGGAGIEYKTRASSDSNPVDREFTTAAALGITQDLDGDGVTGEADEILELIFDFSPPPAADRNWNNFEGSIVVAGKNFAVWPSLEASSACALLFKVVDPQGELRAKQYWVYRSPNGNIFYHFPIEVPFPACP